jgi:hypothetical protein
MWKNCADNAALDSFDQSAAMVSLDECARAFNQASIMDSRRTRGLASATTEAQIEMAGRFVVEFDTAFGERLHQVDSPAWRVHLASSRDVSWTGLGAKPAMNAVEQQFVIANVATRH